MKKTVILLLLISICLAGYSQTIRGTVSDVDTKIPIAYASVYFNGTSTGTLTDNNGNFTLNIPGTGNLPIAISALGYYSVLLSDYSPDKTQLILLSAKSYELNEIVVNAEKSERKKYLEWFKTQFLGINYNGNTCLILNEEDLVFQYDNENDILNVSSNQPLKINNKDLGYLITYYLDSFEYSPVKESLILYGYYSFTDNITDEGLDSLKVERKRKSVYLGSRMHFFRSLWNNKLASDNFTVIGSSNEKLTADSLVVELSNSEKYLVNKRQIKIAYFDKEFDTTIDITEDSVFFDKNGYFDPYGITWSGIMARQRIADLLPFDYIMVK